MRTVNVSLREITTQIILIGLEGEQNSSQIIFDCSELLSDYPDATVSMAIKPPQGNIYPKAVEKVGNTVVWTISSSDCAIPGDGEYQLSFTDGTAIVKTFRGLFTVYDSLIGNGTAPDPVTDWIEDANAVLESLNEISASAEGLPAGENPTAEITTVGGHKNISLGIPKGDKGDTGSTGATPDLSIGTVTTGQPGSDADASITGTPENPVLNLTIPRGSQGEQGEPGKDGEDGQPGFSPTATVTKSGNTATISITDANGTTTAEVSDGTNGTDGYSPVATVTKSGDTATITITDKNGTTTATVSDGEDGQPGATPDFSIGTVTTGEPGTDASATITGTAENPVLNLTIPRGATGEVSEAELSALADRKADVITDSLSNQDIASFSDGANNLPISALSVAIEPVQDLHGYDSPWPGGGGKNLLPSIDSTKTIDDVLWTLNADGSVKLYGTATANSVYDFGRGIVTLEAGTYTTFDITVTGVYSVTIFKIVDGIATSIKPGGGLFTLSEDTSVFVRYVVSAGVTVNTTIYPQVEVGSTPTTFAPYSNLCPITGHTGANVTRTGKNLLDMSKWLDDIGAIYTIDENGWYVVNNTSGNNGTVFSMPYKLPASITGSVLLLLDSARTTATNLRISVILNGSGVAESSGGNPASATVTNKTFDAVRLNFGSGGSFCAKMMVVNSTTISADDFEPYSGTSLPISLTSAGTVYGGVLDVVEGKVRVDRYFVDPTQWTQYNSSNGYIAYKIDNLPYGSKTFAGDEFAISNMIGEFGSFNSSAMTKNIIQPPLKNITTAYLALRNDLSASDVQLCYEMLNPTEITLSSSELRTLLGTNNVWSDAGKVSLTYPADTKLYINKVVASAVASL